MTQDGNQLKVLEEIATSLQELVKLTRVMSYPSVKQMLETVLDTEQKRMVYDLLDGNRKMVDIQRLSGINVSYISQWGQEWEKIGIVEAGARKGRRRKCFDMSMFGVSVSEAPASDTEGTEGNQ
jgi:hypothetical protein